VVSIIMGCRAEQARKQEAITRAQAEDQAEDYRRLLYCNHIALADVAYRNNNIYRLRELLDSCPEDLRGWEWKRLNHISDQSCMTLRGHAGWIIGISPDGKRIASGSYDNKSAIKIWDTETGDELRILRGHEGQVATVFFSPDGKRIISGDTAGTIRVWNATTGDSLMSLKGHKGIIGGKYSPDGRWIISGSADMTLKVWDAETGAELKTLRGHEASPLCHAISPDSRYIVSGGRDNTVRIWDLATGMEVMTLRGHQRSINAVAYSPDGKRIISGSWDTTIKIWDASTGEELMTIPGHKDRIYDVVFSPDGRLIASGSRDGTVKLWDGSIGAELKTLRGHKGSVSSIVFSPDGRLIASGSEDDTIKIWDVDINHDHMHINIDDGAWEVNFSPDGRYILSGSSNGAIKVWNRSTGIELITLHGREDDTIAGAGFSPDGERIVSCQVNETTVWDVKTGEKRMIFRGHEGYLYAKFSPDGKQLACMTVALPWDYNDDTINLLDATTGEELMSINSHRVASVAFSPDGQRIVSGSDDGSITVWNSKTGNKINTLDALEDDMPVSLSVSYILNGKYIISRGTVLIKLWDAYTGAEVMTLPAQQKGIWTMALSPDGKRLVVGDRAGIVKLWDTTTGIELMTLREQRLEEPLSLPVVNFSPDGKTIAIGSSSGIMLLESEVSADSYEPR
jgi:WD40 repeat protein